MHPSVVVSAVIPTFNRPRLVVRAAASALAQSFAELEVLVVVDGPDQQTVAELERLADPRLRVLVLPRQSGPAAARNAGVQAARGEWIAFLDDDDLWLPEKLARQMAVAAASRQRFPIISCRAIARTARGDFVWPNSLPGDEPLSEYLMERRNILRRPGYVATPTLLARRDMLIEVPMPDLDDLEDWGWLLQAAARFDARVESLPEPLCVVHLADDRPSRSQRDHWRVVLDWARRYRCYMTGRAYAAFLVTKVSGQARRQGDWRALAEVVGEIRRHGRPTAQHLLILAGIWLLPAGGHRLVRALSFAFSTRVRAG
ncbi:MAG TPA: glycosyltransferase family 2 protein [Rhodospirillaceae bacterium]|nr:glycosyltransferase family 2 protein [Rhodospirillaceae bacterium]